MEKIADLLPKTDTHTDTTDTERMLQTLNSKVNAAELNAKLQEAKSRNALALKERKQSELDTLLILRHIESVAALEQAINDNTAAADRIAKENLSLDNKRRELAAREQSQTEQANQLALREDAIKSKYASLLNEQKQWESEAAEKSQVLADKEARLILRENEQSHILSTYQECHKQLQKVLYRLNDKRYVSTALVSFNTWLLATIKGVRLRQFEEEQNRQRYEGFTQQ